MPTVSGRLVYDADRNANISGDVTGLANVPIVLQDTASLNRLIVLTDALGDYAFLNVPSGDYQIVESYGLPGGIPTPGDFTLAAVASIPPARVPPIEDMPSPPPGATNVDCVTPNTILLTIAAADIPNQYIFNGAVAYTPLNLEMDPCAIVFPINLITDADAGTFGGFPAGTVANTGTPTNPYPAISPGFTYVVPDPGSYTPIDGEFTIQNTMNDAMSNVIGAWWRISDHTTGNETGRMMIVNEDDPGAIIFRTVAAVAPNTTYLFSTWILNLFRVAGYLGPQFAVRILDEEGIPLYSAALGSEVPTNELFPVWKEIGGVINSRQNNALTIEFFSEGEAAIGNDFAIDDIGLREVRLPQFDLVKSEDRSTAAIGDVVTYTITLSNVCQQPLTNILFWDYIPAGLDFIPGSVMVNGTPAPSANPLVGFAVPDVGSSSTLQITLQVRVAAIPNPNPVVNRSSLRYVYTPIPGGIEDVYTLVSNDVPLLVGEVVADADLSMAKTADRSAARRGEALVYSLTVTNLGPGNAANVVLTDLFPPTLLHPCFSLDGGATWQPWPGTHAIGTLINGGISMVMLRATVADDAVGPIDNTASVASTTPDPNPNNNSATARIAVDPSCMPCQCIRQYCCAAWCQCGTIPVKYRPPMG